MSIELKKDPWVLGTNAVVCVAILALVYLKVIDWKLAIAGVISILTPSMLGRKQDGDPPDPPAPPTVVTMSIGVFVVMMLSGCAQWLHAAEKIDADVANCLVANQDLPDEAALLKCGVQEVDRLIATELIHRARAAAAAQASHAADRARAERCDGGAK